MQVFSSGVAAIASRLSSGPGTGGEEVKKTPRFYACASPKAVMASISIINWWSRWRK